MATVFVRESASPVGELFQKSQKSKKKIRKIFEKMSSEELFGNAIEILTKAREMLEKVEFFYLKT